VSAIEFKLVPPGNSFPEKLKGKRSMQKAIQLAEAEFSGMR
jgi:hypothetical protein